MSEVSSSHCGDKSEYMDEGMLSDEELF